MTGVAQCRRDGQKLSVERLTKTGDDWSLHPFWICMLPDWLPLTATTAAALLTAGFRRHRLFQFSLLMVMMALALLQSDPMRGLLSALAFLPWLFAYAAVMPEARWRARRSAF